jgi:predicted component of type VI protein secretion system
VVIWDTVEITVGRLKSQDIVVQDAEVSREHAVFRKKGDAYSVEDLGTGLGTLVHGERIKVHQLQPGDLVEIGTLEIKFGQTQRPVKPGGVVGYASQLKEIGAPARHAGGQTMLAFDAQDDLVPPTMPLAAPAGPKAVSADGTLEDLSHADLLASEDYDKYLGSPPLVRDLDRELAKDPVMGPTLTTVKLEVELEGPMAQIEAVLAAVADKPIEVPPIKIRIRKP